MISTYDSLLKERIASELRQDGFDVRFQPKIYQTSNYLENDLVGLFMFPVFDMAFLRYEDDVPVFKLDTRTAHAFGVSDYGIFFWDSSGVYVLSPEHQKVFASTSLKLFVCHFQYFAHWILASEHARQCSCDQFLMSLHHLDPKVPLDSGFWYDVANAVSELGVTVSYGLLSYLRDGKMVSV
jgi:hypothetical protein